MLSNATSEREMEVVKLLLEHGGVNVNIKDNDG